MVVSVIIYVINALIDNKNEKYKLIRMKSFKIDNKNGFPKYR